MTQSYDVDASPASNGQGEAYRNASQREASERALGDIVVDLWEKAETLIRQEMRLGLTEAEEKVDVLKTELEAKVGKLKLELAAKALGACVLFAGLLALVASITLLLARAVTPWVAALIVGLAVSALGVALLQRAMRLPDAPKPSELVPRRTIESVKQDVHTITEATK
jgi:hypothetical protein